MKTAIVPAQVTTVEDKLAGNLTVTQLFIMVAGLGLATLIYVLVGPKYHFTTWKIGSILATAIVFGGLSLRIHGRIVSEWLIILTRYWQRPHQYVFTKNDFQSRSIPDYESETATKTITHIKPTFALPSSIDFPSLPERIKVEALLDNPSLAVRFVMAEKGGIDVSLTPTKQ